MDLVDDRLAALRLLDREQVAALLRRVPVVAEALRDGRTLDGWEGARHARRDSRAPSLPRLAALLATPDGTLATLQALTALELQLVVQARWEGGRVERAAVLREAGGDGSAAAALDDAADTLAALALSDPLRGWVALRPGVADLVGLPGLAVGDHLRWTNSDVVASRLRALGVPSAAIPTRKDDRVALLVATLRDPEVVGPLIDRLPPDQARIVATLRRDGAQPVQLLGVPYWSAYRSRARPASALEQLVDLGLLGVDEEQFAFLWLDVLVALRGSLFPAWPSAPSAIAPVPVQQGAATVPPVLGWLDRLLDAWRAEPAPALGTGGLGVRPVRAAAKQLKLPAGTVGLLACLAVDLGLLGTFEVAAHGRGRNRRVDLAWSPTPAADAWRGLSPPERWSRLVQAWARTELCDERDGLPERCDPQRVDGGEAAHRLALLQVLADLPAGAGLAPGDVARHVRYHRPSLVGIAEEGLLAAARVLGLVPDRGPVGFTPLARAVVAGGAEAVAAALPAPRREFLVQADHTVVAPPDLDPALAEELERYAELESAAGARLYRLTEARVAAALADGADADDVLRFLDEHSTVPVAQNVAYLVRDVARRHGQLRAGACASYLRCDDLALLTSAVAVKPAKLRLVGAGVAVSPLQPDRLVAALQGKGLHAVAEDASGAVVVRQAPRADAHRRVALADVAATRPLLVDADALVGAVLGEAAARSGPSSDDDPIARLRARQDLLERFESAPGSLSDDEFEEALELFDDELLVEPWARAVEDG